MTTPGEREVIRAAETWHDVHARATHEILANGQGDGTLVPHEGCTFSICVAVRALREEREGQKSIVIEALSTGTSILSIV